MPSTSPQQQRLFGMALRCKRTGNCPSSKIQNLADSMPERTLRHFAKTKHSQMAEKCNFFKGFVDFFESNDKSFTKVQKT